MSDLSDNFHIDSNREITYVDSFESILNLIDSSLRGESVHTTIVVLLTIIQEIELDTTQTKCAD